MLKNKRLDFWQTRSNSTIFYDCVPADCVEKVVNTKTEEIPHQKVSLSPRAPPKGFAQDNRCVALIASPLAVTMLLHGERASGTSARRRRERRLRSWAKHERMSIAVALAENYHHSRQQVEGNASDGLRAQKSARAAGYHPGVLKDREVQWFKERSLFVSAGVLHWLFRR